MSKSSINERILSEIDSLSAHEDIKKYLKVILEIELDNIDRSKFQYADVYKHKFEEIF